MQLRQRRRPHPESTKRPTRPIVDTVTSADKDTCSQDTTMARQTENKDVRGNELTQPPLIAVSSYQVAKWLLLRSIGVVYLFAFCGALYQNNGLFADKGGLQPIHAQFAKLQDQILSRDSAMGQSMALGWWMERWYGFCQYPTVFWWIPYSDFNMQLLILSGCFLSGLLVVDGLFTTSHCRFQSSWCLLFLLWLLDFSIVTLASLSSSFYSYGWESQLLETGFLSIWLCRLPDFTIRQAKADDDHHELNTHHLWWEKIPHILLSLQIVRDNDYRQDTCHSIRRNDTKHKPLPFSEPSPIILWLFRWLSFRISMGAGLIKLRGSSCWTNYTCLHYHFETQPIPSPLSFVFHFLPKSIQSTMVHVDLWVQVYTSALVLISCEVVGAVLDQITQRHWISYAHARHIYNLSRWTLRIAGVIQAGFMVGILLSGNFAFLNHLTIIPAMACWDDDFVPTFLYRHVTGRRIRAASPKDSHTTPSRIDDNVKDNPKRSNPSSLFHFKTDRGRRELLNLLLLAWISYLSWPVVANLLQLDGARQVMNTSYDSFRLVNTYGAFGSVGTSRYEAIIRISNETSWIANESEAEQSAESLQQWTELELPCKPGNIRRRPCFSAPYHYRLDWNIWFLGFKPHQGMLRQRESWMFQLLTKILQPGNHTVKRPWLALLDQNTATYPKTRTINMDLPPRWQRSTCTTTK